LPHQFSAGSLVSNITSQTKWNQSVCTKIKGFFSTSCVKKSLRLNTYILILTEGLNLWILVTHMPRVKKLFFYLQEPHSGTHIFWNSISKPEDNLPISYQISTI
jgi:hypothetical protein